MKKIVSLPKRAFASPLIWYANFADGSHINLIRLVKPYKNGMAYAIHETTKAISCKSGMFKTYDKAKDMFDRMVLSSEHTCKITELARTNNYQQPC